MATGVLRDLRFGCVLVGRLASLAGETLYNILIMTFLYELTGQAKATAAISIILGVTRLGTALFVAPLIAARAPKGMAIAFEGLRTVTLAALVALSWSQRLGLPALYATAVVIGLAGAVLGPVETALLRLILPDHRLVWGNGVVQTGEQVLSMVGYGVGVLWVDAIGVTPTLVAQLACSLVALGCWTALRPGTDRPQSAQEPLRLRAVRGWTWLWQNRVVRSVTLMDMLEAWANAVWASVILLAYTRVAL